MEILKIHLYNIDDIICFADTKEEMNEILEKVVSVARQNNIKFNNSKLQYVNGTTSKIYWFNIF